MALLRRPAGSSARSRIGVLVALGLMACGPERTPAGPEAPHPTSLALRAGPRAESSPSVKPPSASGRVPAPSALALEELASWVQKEGGRLGGVVVELDSGRPFWSLNERELFHPASTLKLITSAVALDSLGPGFSWTTEVSWDGASRVLSLRGGGAPDLEEAELLLALSRLVARGMAKVSAIEVDQGRFGSDYLPPGFDDQPQEAAPFRAPVSALALHKNSAWLFVSAREAGAPAQVWVEPSGVSKLQGTVKATARGTGDHVSWDLSSGRANSQALSRVAGELEASPVPRSYGRRLDNPLLAPGFVAKKLLERIGAVDAQLIPSLAERTRKRGDGAMVERIASRTLAEILPRLGKDSDNFTAEMLAFALSSADDLSRDKPAEPWSTARGLQVIERWLARHELATDGYQITNGSGLFGSTRISPHMLAGVLTHMWELSPWRAEYMAQLAIGHRDGTLRARFVGAPQADRIRAKTGSLREANALAGYVLPAERGKAALVFVFFVAGLSGRAGEVRARLDQALTQTLSELEQRPSPPPAAAGPN